MNNGKLIPYNYHLNLDKIWNEVSLDWMYEHGCLIYEDCFQLIALIYDEFAYYTSCELFVTSPSEFHIYLLSKDEWIKKYELLKLMGKERYNYSKYSEKLEPKVLNEEPKIEYQEIDTSPVVQMVNIWIEKAIVLGASDIHIEPHANESVIRIRLDGKLTEMDKIRKDLYEEVLARIKIMASLDITKKMLPQDGKLKYQIKDKDYDLRVSAVPTVLGEKIVIRVLDKMRLYANFNNLNYTNNEEKIIKSLLSEKSGMILVTGPTGCGKTTTMYTFLNELNKQDSNIVTIEDPVEYTIDGINQIQVNQQAGLTFAGALRSILRQDPNVIMIGEIRDEETAQIAMRAALSGHLVISTLHTTSSIGAITRLLDMGIPKYLVSSALKVVICQRLVEVLCPKCKEEMKVNPDLRQKLEVDGDVKLYKKRGCQYCFNTGYKGRLLLSEVLEVDDKIKEMILSEASEKKIELYAKKNKMILLSEKHKKAVIDGITTIEEI